MSTFSDRSVSLWVLDIRSWIDPIGSLLQGESVCGMRLTHETMSRLGRFVRPEDARRGAGGELVRRIALGAYAGAAVADAKVLRDAAGKPYLPDFPNVHFNISHSGSIVVCGVDASPIGVDVEMHRPVDPALPACCLTPMELEWLGRDDGDPFEFYTLWTVKESLLKGAGVGLGIDPLQIEVAPIDLEGELWRPREPSVHSSRVQPSAPERIAGTVRTRLSNMVTRTADVAVGYSAAVSTCERADLRVRHVPAPSNGTSLIGNPELTINSVSQWSSYVKGNHHSRVSGTLRDRGRSGS